MRSTSRNKGVSNLVAYVLLITMALSFSVLVYGWLKLWIPRELPECPDGVNLIISGYECSFEKLKLDLTNKGRYSVDGYFVRVHNSSNASFGYYSFNFTDEAIKPGNKTSGTYSQVASPFPTSLNNLNNLTFIEVQPYVFLENKKVLCKDYTSIKVDDCSVQ